MSRRRRQSLRSGHVGPLASWLLWGGSLTCRAGWRGDTEVPGTRGTPAALFWDSGPAGLRPSDPRSPAFAEDVRPPELTLGPQEGHENEEEVATVPQELTRRLVEVVTHLPCRLSWFPGLLQMALVSLQNPSPHLGARSQNWVSQGHGL